MHDIMFEAAYLRAGLLIGVCHERDVPDWAERLIVDAPHEWTPRLADVLGCQVELSAMREALRPLADSVDADRVVGALLTSLAVQQAILPRDAGDLLRRLGQLTLEFRVAPEVAARITSLAKRMMLARAGVRGEVAPGPEDVMTCLDEVREPGCFRLDMGSGDEAAAFVAALSRKVERDRTWGERGGRAPARAWLLRDGPHGYTVVLNETALLIVLREFGALPARAMIPYREPGAGAVCVIDEATVTPLGVEEARAIVCVPEAD